jgi:hypothetical protein
VHGRILLIMADRFGSVAAHRLRTAPEKWAGLDYSRLAAAPEEWAGLD